jgi:hypothetical protein
MPGWQHTSNTANTSNALRSTMFRAVAKSVLTRENCLCFQCTRKTRPNGQRVESWRVFGVFVADVALVPACNPGSCLPR